MYETNHAAGADDGRVPSKSAPGANFTTKLDYDFAVNGVTAVKAGKVICCKVQG